jgi:hypothetical protein
MLPFYFFLTCCAKKYRVTGFQDTILTGAKYVEHAKVSASFERLIQLNDVLLAFEKTSTNLELLAEVKI